MRMGTGDGGVGLGRWWVDWKLASLCAIAV